jgi:hypothetical protein
VHILFHKGQTHRDNNISKYKASFKITLHILMILCASMRGKKLNKMMKCNFNVFIYLFYAFCVIIA